MPDPCLWSLGPVGVLDKEDRAVGKGFKPLAVGL